MWAGPWVHNLALLGHGPAWHNRARPSPSRPGHDWVGLKASRAVQFTPLNMGRIIGLIDCWRMFVEQ